MIDSQLTVFSQELQKHHSAPPSLTGPTVCGLMGRVFQLLFTLCFHIYYGWKKNTAAEYLWKRVQRLFVRVMFYLVNSMWWWPLTPPEAPIMSQHEDDRGTHQWHARKDINSPDVGCCFLCFIVHILKFCHEKLHKCKISSARDSDTLQTFVTLHLNLWTK